MRAFQASLIGVLVAIGVVTTTGPTALRAQDRSLELTNTSEFTAGWVRILDDAGLESQTFTIEAWITPKGSGFGSSDSVGAMIVAKPRENQGGNVIQSFGLSWVPGTEKMRAIVAHQLGSSGTTLFSTKTVPVNQSQHVAMSFDGTWLRLYIDGGLDSQKQASSSVVDYEDNDVLIGAANFNAGSLRRFQGEINDVRIWDHVRTVDQLTSLDSCHLVGDEDGLLAYYSFDAANATDDSNNGHDGTIDGMADFPDSMRICPAFSDGFESGDVSAWSSSAS